MAKTNITSKVRIGERYQADIPSGPSYISMYRPVEQWRIWSGCSNPQDRPSEDHMRRFK